MKPFSKAIILTITLVMVALNATMLTKLVERIQARIAQPYAETRNIIAPNKDLVQVQPAPMLPPPRTTQPEEKIKTPAKILAQCLIDASHFYKIPPAVMIGILHVEGGKVGKESGPNADGTYDLGPMQVNSSWLPKLARAWNVDVHKARTVMRNDGCMNVKVAAWILHKNISEAGSVYTGIAHYHSITPELGRPYAAKVEAALEQKGLRID